MALTLGNSGTYPTEYLTLLLLLLLWLCSPLVRIGPFFSSLILYIVGRTPYGHMGRFIYLLYLLLLSISKILAIPQAYHMTLLIGMLD
jgi:hypothetical protein